MSGKFGALYLEDMKGLRCSVKGCDHSSHKGEIMYLHQSCHLGKGVTVRIDVPGVVLMRCAACEKPIIHIAVAEDSEIPPYPICHPGMPFYVYYVSGVLHFECMACAVEQGKMTVLSHEDEDSEVIHD